MFFIFWFPKLFLITTILLIARWGTGNKIYGKVAGYFWLSLFGIFILGTIIRSLTNQKILEKEDYYGEYIIDRDYFPGRQADWQYDHFRFEIKENDSIYFYVTEKEKIVKTYSGTITTTAAYRSKRLITKMEQPTHHVVTSNPTTYRSAWDFYLVFHSHKFNNVYFKKGHWKNLDR